MKFGAVSAKENGGVLFLFSGVFCLFVCVPTFAEIGLRHSLAPGLP